MKALRVTVGMGSCGLAAGAGRLYEMLESLLLDDKVQFELSVTSCVGMCYAEPLVEVTDKNGSALYGSVDETRLNQIIESHIIKGIPLDDWVVRSDYLKSYEDSFFGGQKRIALRNCGLINPGNINDYIERKGYEALKHIASKRLKPEEVIETVIASGLRGRGGGGFPTGKKWDFTRRAPGNEKYLICNADEGDPGAFMDRSLIEGDPHSVIEGMIIAAYAIGASEGFVYCRAEYPLAIRRLKHAISQATEHGLLGENIAGIGGFSFSLAVREGAGAFVCGEETALIASVEGRRGMPNRKPPFPSDAGLWSKPTCINNVETFANIPWIIANGARAFSAIGTSGSKGTKVFALTGKIRRGGLAEVPMGITINEIINGPGGGLADNHLFKAVQLGGPSGGCLPASLGNTPIDYESLSSTGAIMGSGGMVVMDETTCMVDMARFFLNFTCQESCGKCTFCRIGTKRMLEILERICGGDGCEEDLTLLEELSEQIRRGSLCGLGQTAPNPVLTTLRYFRDEYIAHIRDKKCPAHTCTRLLTYTIDSEKCTGCSLCAGLCPSSAITGEIRSFYTIDSTLCVRCGVCYDKCPFKAIERE